MPAVLDRPALPAVALSGPAAGRLARLSIFDGRHYLAANPDVAAAGIDPWTHALSNGIAEGRQAVSHLAAARIYGRVAKGEADFRPVPAAPGHTSTRCTVFVHSTSHEGHHALAASLAADLGRAGFSASVSDERADHRGDHGVALFVAAHDFFDLGRGPLWRDPAILGDGFIVLDDPVGSLDCDRTLGALLEARGVVDTSAVGAAAWTEAGIPAAQLRPRAPLRSGWLSPDDLAEPLMRAAPPAARRLLRDPAEPGDRPLDLLLFAPEAPARNAALGRLAAHLSGHRCFVYLQQGARSHFEAALHRRTHWRIAGHLSARSRLTLSLSPSALPLLDRRHIVGQAMAGGSVVVSDVRFVEPGLEAGVHYLADDARHLGALIDWALRDAEGRAMVERVREQAFDHVAALNGDPRRLDGLKGLLQAGSGDGVRG